MWPANDDLIRVHLWQNCQSNLGSTFAGGSREPTSSFLGHLCTELQAAHWGWKELAAERRTGLLEQIRLNFHH